MSSRGMAMDVSECPTSQLHNRFFHCFLCFFSHETACLYVTQSTYATKRFFHEFFMIVKFSVQLYYFHDLFHRIVEQLVLEGTLKITQFQTALQWAGMPPARSGCPGSPPSCRTGLIHFLMLLASLQNVVIFWGSSLLPR